VSPLERVLDRLDSAKAYGAGWIARCPAHEDRNPSLSIGENGDGVVLLHCHAGCSVEKILAELRLELHDLYPQGDGGGSTYRNSRQVVQLVSVDGERVDDSGGLTVEQLAEAKRLPVSLLLGLGCETVRYFGPSAVQIPYTDVNGNLAATRYRLALAGQTKYRWRKGTKASTLLYAAPRLRDARDVGYVVIVEGESDAWTLIHHGHPVVALPGASMWSDEEHASKFDGIETVFVVAEPDQGGETLLGKLRASSLRPRLRIVALPTKDVSELHLADEAAFPARFAAAMDTATTLVAVEEEHRRELAAEAWADCQTLARKRDILHAFASKLRERGFVGSTDTPKLIFLVLVSRILRKPVSLVLRGLSSAGKSYNVESVLPFFPASAYFDRSGMSERALVYSTESFEHRILYIAEADAFAAEGLGAYFLRTLISENRLVYETVEKDGDRLVTRVIVKPGPIGVILTTTRLRLHPENETRLLALTVPDDPALTRKIMRVIAQRDDEAEEELPAQAWHALQAWLELRGERRVVDQDGFLLALAELVPVVAVRLRRDFALVRSLVFAHAILHQANRPRDPDGRVVATLDDYGSVRKLIAVIVAEGIGATVSNDVRETVAAVAAALEHEPGDVVKRAQVQAELELDDRATNRRLAQAVDAGFVENTNPGRGKAGLYKLGMPIPEDVDVLPSVEDVRLHLVNLDNLAPDHGDRHPPLPGARLNGGGGRRGFIPGDDGFPDWIDEKFHDGWITEREWIELRKVHAMVGRPT
jgi:hypothetical protein